MIERNIAITLLRDDSPALRLLPQLATTPSLARSPAPFAEREDYGTLAGCQAVGGPSAASPITQVKESSAIGNRVESAF